MPSPFPGMNPYLEQDDAWHDFHERFIPLIAERLGSQLMPDYMIKIDEHIYIHELADDEVMVAPMRVRIPAADTERLAFIEIRDRLQEALQRVFDAAGYEYYIYEGRPNPPLTPADAEWAAQFVSAIP